MVDVRRLEVALALIAGVLLACSGLSSSDEGADIRSLRVRQLCARLERAGAEEKPAVVSGFLDENRDRLPLIEDSLVTFVYNGKVGLRVTVPSDINRWNTKVHQMTRLEGTDLHYLTLVMPMDARIDYKFYVDGLWMLDPLNSRTIRGTFGDNSEFSMPQYVPSYEISWLDTVNHGTVDVHYFESDIVPGTRKIQVYLPFSYRPFPEAEGVTHSGSGVQQEDRDLGSGGAYPVIYVQDGSQYVTLGLMVNVLDNIIDDGRIPPVVGIFIDPVDKNYEYWLNADYERMLIDEIMPFVREQYEVSTEPHNTAVMGALLGGAMSFMIAMDYPELFGKCGCQSAVFEIEDGNLITKVRERPRQPVDLYIDCGTYGDLTGENRRMRAILSEKGYNLEYRESNEGRSWGNWRAHIDDVLVFFWGRREEPNEDMAE